MFNLNQIPRKYFIGAIGALIVVLLVVTLWKPTNFGYKDTTDYAARIKQAEVDRTEYERLLASINVTQQESEVALKKIATEDVVKEEVNTSFQTDQKIVIPDIPNSELAITPRGGQDAVVQYLSDTGTLMKNYNARTGIAHQTVFSSLQDDATLAAAAKETTTIIDKLKKTPVPEEVLAYHKAQIVALQQYDQFLNTAQSYDPAITPIQLQPRGTGPEEPWPAVYRDYAIINNKAGVINAEYQKFDQKYSLSKLPPITLAMDGPNASVSSQLHLINEAHAFLGFGDLTITIGDIPSLILEGVKEGLKKAFMTFIVKAIDKLVAKIDKYFTITSQLYYSQELGKLYTKEYWTKFNVPQADQNILANFIPDYFCVPKNVDELKQIFTAKSKALLKYDIKTLALNSDNYYEALAELGSAAQTNPDLYWTDYYSSFAAQTKAAASDAATKEVTSAGVKSGRDLISGQVDKTLSKVLNVQESSVGGVLDLGSSQADSLISTLIAGVFSSLTTKFIFTAVSSGERGGGLGVLNETNLCLSTAKYKPVVPGASDPQDAIDSQNAQLEACRGLIKAAESIPDPDPNDPNPPATGKNSPAYIDCMAMVNSLGG